MDVLSEQSVPDHLPVMVTVPEPDGAVHEPPEEPLDVPVLAVQLDVPEQRVAVPVGVTVTVTELPLVTVPEPDVETETPVGQLHEAGAGE